MKKWVLNEDLLEIVDGNLRIQANADQVYSSVLEGNSPWPDLEAGKSGDADGLQFSPYPVYLFAVVLSDIESSWPLVQFEARTRKGRVFPMSSQAAACGHVVYEQKWYPIVPGDSEAIFDLLKKSDYCPKNGRIQKLAGILSIKRVAIEGGQIIDKYSEDALERLIFEIQSGKKTTPSGITAELYPYQQSGWWWLRFIIQEKLGGLLADEMGLGKTLQIICALRDPGDEMDLGCSLVLAPGSLLENWVREITKFCPDLRTLKHHGIDRTGSPFDLLDYDVVVTSYDSAVRDLSLLKMVEWETVILDEAQNIRNPVALRTKSVKELRRRVGIAVTGTPVENRLRDLWSIIDFALPGYLGNLDDFEKSYDGINGATKLEPIITPLILRRSVKEVAQDLPERIDITEILELDENEAGIYEEIREEILEEYKASATLVTLVKLRQFCSHPILLERNSSLQVDKFTKYKRLTELLGEIFSLDEKVLVFTSYTKMADIISDYASSHYGAISATLDGRLEIRCRQRIIDQFSEHMGPGVLVLNPRTGGSGLNITAANHVIHYNPEWNPAVEDQASARAFRRGQERPVTIRRLIFANTVEELIEERLERKRGIAEKAILGVEGKTDDYVDIMSALERSPLRV